MRCMNCDADILPAYVKAIENNICPGCGDQIYNTATSELMTELTEAMKKMPNDPQGIVGWLMSNYQFRKIGDAAPVEKFYRKGGGGDGFDESKLKVDPTYNQFIKRNGAEKLVAKGQELAALKGSGKLAECVAAIQSVSDPYGDDGAGSEIEGNGVSVEDQKEYAALKASGIDPFSTVTPEMLANASPADIINMELATHKLDEPVNFEALIGQSDEGKALLQREMFKKVRAQEAILGGGAFRR